MEIKFDLILYYHEEYKRTGKSFMDILANICSLSVTVLNVLSLFFVKYYSHNFDNYKIIEKILFKANSINVIKEDKKKIELENYLNESDKNDNLIDKSNEDKNIIKVNGHTEKIEYADNEEFLENNQDNQDNDDINNNKRYLPKLRFIDFLYNNIYIEKLCKLNKQKIIDKCNKIISKYYSIELVLYNQIMFENLLKDYKWNDPELNNFDNNELIIQLKNFISLIRNN